MFQSFRLKLKKALYIASIFVFPFFLSAQEEAFKNEFYYGVTLHTSGWGVNLTHSKYLTSKQRQLIEFDLVSMRHPKQQKVKPQREKKYVYGKLNSVYSFRGGYGRKSVLAKDFNNKGVEISFSYSGGLSLAAVKPVYLNIYNPRAPQTPTLERYNPEIHSFGNIFSGAPNFTGLNEITPVFGAYAKVGFMFDYSPYKNYVRAIETGFILDYYLSPIPMMAHNTNYSFFPNLYLKIMFGRVYK